MPGVFGFLQRSPSGDADLAMRDLMRSAGELPTEVLTDPGFTWGLGRKHLGVLQPERQLHADDGVHALFHGDLHNRVELESLVGRPAPAGSSGAAWLTAALYQRFGSDFAAYLDGTFCAVVLDPARGIIVLAADVFGSYPIYWQTTGGRLVFASELRGILCHVEHGRELDPAAVADYLTFGFPLGVKTLARCVELVPEGSTVTFENRNGSVEVRRYANIAQAFAAPWTGSRAGYLEAVQHAFTQSVGRALSGSHHFGLSLSGGLDSRAILSAVDGAAASLTTCTVGIKGCADEVIAGKLARASGTRHRFYELDGTETHAFLPGLRQMVELTDGMYMSHGLTEPLALRSISTTGIDVLLRGHGGELAKTRLAWPLHTDEHVARLRTTGELVSYLLTRVNYVSRGLDWDLVFTPSWQAALRDAPRASLERSFDGLDLAPPDLCSYMYLQEHHRRSTVASLELFRHAVEVRMPFVDRAFLELLFSGRPEWREDTSIHRGLISSGNASLLSIRDSNTGAPIDAGPMSAFLLDKVNSVLKRMNVDGYRHYHRAQDWTRQRFLEAVDSVLLAPKSLDRGVLRESGVRTLLEDTRSGRADHSYVLQILLILELWQRGDES